MRPSKIWSFIWPKVFAVKIRVKIMGIAVGLVLLLGLGVILLVRSSFRATLIDQAVERGTAIASDVAARSAAPILAGDIAALRDLIGEMAKRNEDIHYIFILDRSRDIFVHTFAGHFPSDLLAVNAGGGADGSPGVEVLDTGTEEIFDIAMPIESGREGAVHIGISDRRLDRTVAIITRDLLLITGIASLLGVIAAYVLTAILTRPILELVEAAEAVGEGDFQRRAPIWANDEVGHLCAAFNDMAGRLSDSREKSIYEEWMRSQLLEKVFIVQEEERKRVARELHDQTSQSLASLMVGLKTAEMAGSLEEAKGRIVELRRLTVETLEEVHSLALALRPSIFDDLGLIAALERYAADFARQFSIDVDFQSTGFADGRRLPPQLEMPLYRIVQEALTNAARHAEPENISVLIERREGRVLVIVEDDGKGFDVAEVMGSRMENKLGIFGMQERAALVDGKLTIESNLETGTTVFVEIPISQGG